MPWEAALEKAKRQDKKKKKESKKKQKQKQQKKKKKKKKKKKTQEMFLQLPSPPLARLFTQHTYPVLMPLPVRLAAPITASR